MRATAVFDLKNKCFSVQNLDGLAHLHQLLEAVRLRGLHLLVVDVARGVARLQVLGLLPVVLQHHRHEVLVAHGAAPLRVVRVEQLQGLVARDDEPDLADPDEEVLRRELRGGAAPVGESQRSQR